MLTAYKRKRGSGFSPWHGFLFLIIIGFAFGLKIVNALKPTVVPRSDVPAVAFQDVQSESEQFNSNLQNDLEVILEPSQESGGDTDPELVHEPLGGELDSDGQLQTEIQTLPAEFNLAVPFTSQAPTGNWDAVHEDACEEASFLMVTEFYAGKQAGKLEASYVDQKLLDMINKQTSLGMGYSISAEQTVQFIQEYFGLQARILDKPSVEQIKTLIHSGKPVLVPAAGRELDNPFFTGEGPLYHMLVLRGFTADAFIANDPGTRNGENYRYSIETIMQAIGDWNSGDPATGEQRIIYIEPR
jgi:hypothetical protein